jgi:hypothetical protein
MSFLVSRAGVEHKGAMLAFAWLRVVHGGLFWTGVLMSQLPIYSPQRDRRSPVRQHVVIYRDVLSVALPATPGRMVSSRAVPGMIDFLFIRHSEAEQGNVRICGPQGRIA